MSKQLRSCVSGGGWRRSISYTKRGRSSSKRQTQGPVRLEEPEPSGIALHFGAMPTHRCARRWIPRDSTHRAVEPRQLSSTKANPCHIIYIGCANRARADDVVRFWPHSRSSPMPAWRVGGCRTKKTHSDSGGTISCQYGPRAAPRYRSRQSCQGFPVASVRSMRPSPR